MDLVIEQVLMRSLKTSGGLTRDRGMIQQQRLIWLLPVPAYAETNRSVQELTGVRYNLGEKNKEMTKGRQRHDMKDTLVILTVLAYRNRFAPNPNLTNIMNSIMQAVMLILIVLELPGRTEAIIFDVREVS